MADTMSTDDFSDGDINVLQWFETAKTKWKQRTDARNPNPMAVEHTSPRLWLGFSEVTRLAKAIHHLRSQKSVLKLVPDSKEATARNMEEQRMLIGFMHEAAMNDLNTLSDIFSELPDDRGYRMVVLLQFLKALEDDIKGVELPKVDEIWTAAWKELSEKLQLLQDGVRKKYKVLKEKYLPIVNEWRKIPVDKPLSECCANLGISVNKLDLDFDGAIDDIHLRHLFVLQERFDSKRAWVAEDVFSSTRNLCAGARNNLALLLKELSKLLEHFPDQLRTTQLLSDQKVLQKLIELNRLNGNIHILLLGASSSGKSTFLNALLRGDIMPTHSGACTHSLCHIAWGEDTSFHGCETLSSFRSEEEKILEAQMSRLGEAGNDERKEQDAAQRHLKELQYQIDMKRKLEVKEEATLLSADDFHGNTVSAAISPYLSQIAALRPREAKHQMQPDPLPLEMPSNAPADAPLLPHESAEGPASAASDRYIVTKLVLKAAILKHACLIDSPGFDDTDELDHLVTDRIYGATGRVIVMKAEGTSFSASLQNRLRNLQADISGHRTFFVLTHWDQVPARQRQEILDQVATRILHVFPTWNPRNIAVLDARCAALAVQSDFVTPEFAALQSSFSRFLADVQLDSVGALCAELSTVMRRVTAVWNQMDRAARVNPDQDMKMLERRMAKIKRTIENKVDGKRGEYLESFLQYLQSDEDLRTAVKDAVEGFQLDGGGPLLTALLASKDTSTKEIYNHVVTEICRPVFFSKVRDWIVIESRKMLEGLREDVLRAETDLRQCLKAIEPEFENEIAGVHDQALSATALHAAEWSRSAREQGNFWISVVSASMYVPAAIGTFFQRNRVDCRSFEHIWTDWSGVGHTAERMSKAEVVTSRSKLQLFKKHCVDGFFQEVNDRDQTSFGKPKSRIGAKEEFDKRFPTSKDVAGALCQQFEDIAAHKKELNRIIAGLGDDKEKFEDLKLKWRKIKDIVPDIVKKLEFIQLTYGHQWTLSLNQLESKNDLASPQGFADDDTRITEARLLPHGLNGWKDGLQLAMTAPLELEKLLLGGALAAEPVTIKTLKRTTKRAKTYSKLLRLLSHANAKQLDGIIAVRGTFVTVIPHRERRRLPADAYVHVVMEKMKMNVSELLANIREGRMRISPYSAVHLLLHVSKALLTLHSMGIAHGALNPNHVFIDNNFNAKLHGFQTAGPVVDAFTASEVAKKMSRKESLSQEELMSGDIYSFGWLMWTLFHPAAGPPAKASSPVIDAENFPCELGPELVKRCLGSADERPKASDLVADVETMLQVAPKDRSIPCPIPSPSAMNNDSQPQNCDMPAAAPPLSRRHQCSSFKSAVGLLLAILSIYASFQLLFHVNVVPHGRGAEGVLQAQVALLSGDLVMLRESGDILQQENALHAAAHIRSIAQAQEDMSTSLTSRDNGRTVSLLESQGNLFGAADMLLWTKAMEDNIVRQYLNPRRMLCFGLHEEVDPSEFTSRLQEKVSALQAQFQEEYSAVNEGDLATKLSYIDNSVREYNQRMWNHKQNSGAASAQEQHNLDANMWRDEWKLNTQQFNVVEGHKQTATKDMLDVHIRMANLLEQRDQGRLRLQADMESLRLQARQLDLADADSQRRLDVQLESDSYALKIVEQQSQSRLQELQHATEQQRRELALGILFIPYALLPLVACIIGVLVGATAVAVKQEQAIPWYYPERISELLHSAIRRAAACVVNVDVRDICLNLRIVLLGVAVLIAVVLLLLSQACFMIVEQGVGMVTPFRVSIDQVPGVTSTVAFACGMLSGVLCNMVFLLLAKEPLLTSAFVAQYTAVLTLSSRQWTLVLGAPAAVLLACVWQLY